MVIVTQNQYILASKINHITMDEQISTINLCHPNGRTYQTIDHQFQITVVYTPEVSHTINNNLQTHGNRGDELRECTVVIRGAVHAYTVFKDLIQQIREQMPDQLYLDTALERMLTGVDMDALKDKDSNQFKLETKNAIKPSAKKVRKLGKAKRANKKVLRRTKRKR